MIPIEVIRENTNSVKERLRERGVQDADAKIDEIIALDNKRRKLQTQYDALRQSVKAKGEALAELKRSDDEDPDKEAQLLRELAELKKSVKPLEEKLKESAQKIFYNLIELPNIHTIPEGKYGREAKDADKKIDKIKPCLSHWEWLRKADWVDFEKGAEVAGTGFVFFKGKGARLVRALINFFIDSAVKAGYTEINPPLLVNEETAFGTGQLPDKDGQMYRLKDDPYYLIPTGEVPLTNLYRNRIIDEKELPIKLVGHTPCFRREAGSWGANTRGLNRLHQFDKVEIVEITERDTENFSPMEKMCNYVASLIRTLELPFRFDLLKHKDLGFAAAFTYDFEVYAGYQYQWLEVSSVSYFWVFQSARMTLRVKRANGKIEYPHTYNGSALALPRIIAALVENNQSEGGRVLTLPKALLNYLGDDFGEVSEAGIRVRLPETAVKELEKAEKKLKK